MMKFISSMACAFIVTCAHAAVPASKHIFVIILENQSYERVVGSSNAPYFNSLISRGALATQFFANVHGSFLVRQYLYAGRGINPTNTSSCFTEDNLVSLLLTRGLRWKSFNEQLPFAGDLVNEYLDYRRGHNVLTNWLDTCARSQRFNSVPFLDSTVGFWHDIKYNSFASFNDIDPDLADDMHNPTTYPGLAIRNGDAWLKGHVPWILTLPEFQAGGDGQLWLIFDEGNLYPKVDSRNGGGRVAVLLLGPRARKGFKSSIFHTDVHLLRTWGLSFGFTSFPGAAQYSRSMSEMFK